MSFQFRFAAILDLRCRERDEAGVAVGQALEAIGRINDQLQEIQSLRDSNRQQSMQSRLGAITVDGLLSQGRYDLQLEADMHALKQTLAQLDLELARRQDELVAAESEVKRFERLEANERSAYLADQNRREQLELDDATSRTYALKTQALRQHGDHP